MRLKNIYFLRLLALIAVCLISATAFAESIFEVDGIYYKRISLNEVEVTYNPAMLTLIGCNDTSKLRYNLSA